MNYKLSNVCTHEKSLWVQIPPHRRSIAQLGRASRLGREGRRFESCYSDQRNYYEKENEKTTPTASKILLVGFR